MPPSRPPRPGGSGKAAGLGRATLARTAAKGKAVANGAVSIAPNSSGTLVLKTTKKGKKALKAAAAKPRQLKKQAAAPLKLAAHTHDPAAAAKLRATAAKLQKEAKKLANKSLGTVTITLVNPANGATSTIKAKLKR